MGICYRCGYCGNPTLENGSVMILKDINLADVDWDKAELTHGECCANQVQNERESRIVTREMAIDAGDSSLEGHSL